MPFTSVARVTASQSIADQILDMLRAGMIGLLLGDMAARELLETSDNRGVVRLMASILKLRLQRIRKVEHLPNFDQIRERDADQTVEVVLRHIIHFAATYDTTGNH